MLSDINDFATQTHNTFTFGERLENERELLSPKRKLEAV